MSTEASKPPVEPGDVVGGKYSVERVVGTGAMGVLVVARHLQLGERVALKFLRPTLAHRSDVVARFLREARALVRIKSEHVARVLDVGTMDRGLPYIVMEFLEGSDLQQIQRARGRLRVDEAVEYVVQACEAVAQAHAAGIVHRDLKPSNLFLTRRSDGSPLVKVLDFGISKIVANEVEQTDLTTTGGIIGSPAYMSPEQARSARNADARSDVWSLGVILHQLMAGSPPFAGESMTELLSAILSGAPKPLTSACPGAPAELEAVILKCLEKDPSHRMPDVAGLATALAQWVRPETRALIPRIAGTLPAQTSRGRSSSSAPPAPVALSGPPVVRTMSGWQTASWLRPTRSRILVTGVAMLAGALVALFSARWAARQGALPLAPGVAVEGSARAPATEASNAVAVEGATAEPPATVPPTPVLPATAPPAPAPATAAAASRARLHPSADAAPISPSLPWSSGLPRSSRPLTSPSAAPSVKPIDSVMTPREADSPRHDLRSLMNDRQ